MTFLLTRKGLFIYILFIYILFLLRFLEFVQESSTCSNCGCAVCLQLHLLASMMAYALYIVCPRTYNVHQLSSHAIDSLLSSVCCALRLH